MGTENTQPAQSISLRLSSDPKTAVEVRIMDRGGEVRVTVHSPDPATAETVRAGLPDLVQRLGERGFETEIWRPPAAQLASRSESQAQGQEPRQGGQGFEQNPEHARNQRQPRPQWIEELEAGLAPKGTGVS